MKFVCDRCQTRYSIADEKVRQRILRIRCKTCSNVITVQAGAVVTSAQDSPTRQEPGAGSPSASRPSSRLSLPPTRSHEWFVAVDGAEQGPLSCTTAAKYIVSLKPEQSVHVWKEGMDGWKRPKDVATITQEISALRLAPARASSQMPVVPADASSARRPVPSPADSAARLQVPGSRPKPPPAGGAGSGPKLPPPGISGSGARLPLPLPGSGPKLAPPPVPGSGPKAAPPPIPGSGPKLAPPPVPGPGAKPAPAGGPGLKTPPPVSSLGAKLAPTGGSGLELAQVSDSKLPAGGLSLKKGPALPGLTPSSPPPAPRSAAPGSGVDNAPSTKPEKRPSRTQAVAALGTDSARPTAAPGPRSDDEFDQASKTPLPSKPLPPIAAAVGGGHPLDHPPALRPPVRLSGTGAAVAMKLPVMPATAAGSLFGNLTPPPDGARVQSDMSKLAALAQRHRHLKYVVAAGVVVVLVVLVILLSWRGESGKPASPVLQREGPARVPEAPSLGEVEPPPQTQAAAAAPAARKGRTHARGAARRSAAVRAARPSGKGAAVGEDPFDGPSPSSHLVERPAPVQKPGQSRGSRSGSPGGAGREVPQEQIAVVVRSKENQAGLKTCYERALKRDGRLRTGRLDITVSVGENGTVRQVQVHGPSDFLIIDSCIKDAIRHWRFPASPEEYSTSFPLILQGG